MPTRGAAAARPGVASGITVAASWVAGSVKVNRAPRPGPSLSAQMRPPCASTIPLQTARPRPAPPPWSSDSTREKLPEQVGQTVGRDAPAHVDNRYRNVDSVPPCDNPDDGRLGESAWTRWTAGCR